MGRWRPAFLVFGSSLPSSTKTAWNIKKIVVRVKAFWTPASAKRERERERERERGYGVRETFSHNFDFYVVQTAERVYVIVMWREINLCLHTDSKLGKTLTMITRLSRNQKQNKSSVFSWMCFNNCWKTCWNRKFDKNAFQKKAFFGNMQWTDTDACENIPS